MSRPEFVARRVWVLVAYLVVLVAACVGVAGGLGLWGPLLLGALPWVLVISAGRGGVLAVATTVIGVAAVILVGMILSWAVSIPITITFAVLAGLLGAGGAFAALRAGRLALPRPSLLIGAAGLIGGAVWLLAIIVAPWFGRATHYAWAMNGDSANNVLFARGLLDAGGIALGANENPVPLTAGLLGFGMAAGRSAVASSGLLQHDVDALVGLWSGLIVLICLLAGLVASASVPAHRTVVRVIVTAGASVLPLTWYIVGYPLEYGFLNTHIVLALVLCGWLVYLRSERRPAFALGLLAVSATLVLAVWAPLVMFPAALLLVLVIRRWRALWATRGLDAAVALAGAGQLLLFGLVVTLPTFVNQSGYLVAPGGAAPIPRFVLAAFVVATVVGGLLVRRPLGSGYLLGSIAMAGAAVGGMAALLFAARTAPDPWLSYYPLKFAWLAGVVLFLVIVGTVTGFAAHRWRGTISTTIAFAVIAIVSFGALEATSLFGAPIENPLLRVLRGNFSYDGDQTPRRIFDYADLEHPTLAWRTGDPSEAFTNFWVMQMQAQSTESNFDLRVAAYGDYDVKNPDDLCRIIDLMDAPVTVRTTDPAVVDEIADTCPTADVLVVVDAP